MLLLVSHSLTSDEQLNKIDSLKSVLAISQNDSVNLKVYRELGRVLEMKDFDTAMYYFNKAISLAAKNNWSEEEAKTHINIGFAYLYSKNSKKSIEKLKQGLDIYISTGNKKEQLDTYYNLGYFYANFENFSRSIEYFNKAARLGEELNNEKRLTGIYNNLGLIYHYIGHYDKANALHFKSLHISERIGNKSVGFTHVNIGLNYNQQKKYRKSLEHNKIALELFLEEGNKSYVAHVLKNIGDNFSDLYQLDSAEYYYNKSFAIYKELDDKESIARHQMLMGILNQKNGNLEIAELKYYEALNSVPENGSRRLVFAINSNLAGLNFIFADSVAGNRLKYLKKAVNYASNMYDISKELQSLSKETESLEMLYKAYMKIGNSQEAIKYADRYIVAIDSLYSEQKQKTITDIQIKYETEKKELEIELLNSENDLISAKLDNSNTARKNQKMVIYLLTLGFLMVCVFIFVIYKFYRQTKRVNNVLYQKNDIISKQNEEKEILLKEIHHRVKNNLQLISSLFDLQMDKSDNIKVRSVFTDAQSRLKSIAIIHEILNQNENKNVISFKSFINELTESICYSLSGNKKISLSTEVGDDLLFDIKKTISLGLIINELLTNSIKYACSEEVTSIIKITITRLNKNDIMLEFSDNGDGLPQGFDIDSADSLGLRLVNVLIEQLSGKINYIFDSGAKFTIEFPDTINLED